MNNNVSNLDIKKVLNNITNSLDDENYSIKNASIELHKLLDIIEENNKIPLPKYEDLSIEETKKNLDRIINLWNAFVNSNDGNLDESNIDINERNLSEVIERVNKRRYHYDIYHNMSELSEIREIALLCYWIVKLKPFTVLDNQSPLRNSANEFFCVYLIMAIIEYLTEKAEKPFEMPSNSLIKDTVYILKYRDLSKEAIILFVSTIAQNYGIDIDSFI